MPQQLLSAAREQAERSEPSIKAAALLHIARVLTTVDRAEADRVLEEGIALTTALPEDDRSSILSEAVSLAAAVSPQRAFRLVPAVVDRRFAADRMIVDMLHHGHLADAVSYLGEPTRGDEYPFVAARAAIGRCREDDDMRRRILRGAIRAMRDNAQSGQRSSGLFRGSGGFLSLFTLSSSLLPADEATEVVREIVRWILDEPDRRTRATFSSGPDTVRFSSTREQHLFEILGPLQRLDPALAESLCHVHSQLGSAAERFPSGIESMNEGARRLESTEAPREGIAQPDYIDVGHRLIPIPEALNTGFRDAFEEAYRLYARDTDLEHPNYAPRECWPSTQEFRKILFKAGEHEGVAAARHLDRIPDPSLRLFAQIELAAALAGLPQIGGSRRYHPNRSR